MKENKFYQVDVMSGKLTNLTLEDEFMRYKRREWVKNPELRILEANQPEYLEYRQKLI